MNRMVNGIAGAMRDVFGYGDAVERTAYGVVGLDDASENPAILYEVMRDLAANTNAYREIRAVLGDYGLGETAIQGLRNPTNAVCAFYEANLWPGTVREGDSDSALEIVASGAVKNPAALAAAIHRVWRWSNINEIKDGAAYDAAMLGDQVFRIVSDPATGRAWFELIDPEYLTDYDVDGRGYLSWVRIDVPENVREADGKVRRYVHTEIWDKASGTYRRWRRAAGVSLSRLGRADDEITMDQMFGWDFVPFVHWRFTRASGSGRGVPAVMRALDKVVYGDALVTALHQRLTRYNQPDWAIEGTGVDRDGFPMAAPALGATIGEVVEAGGGKLWRLPAGWRMRDLVAGLDYESHLAVVEAHYTAMRETDLHELAWGAVTESNAESGRAIDYRLTPAKSKLERARGRGDASLIRATQMALSVCQAMGAAGFSEAEIGTYASGAFDFWFADRAMVPVSVIEASEMETAAAARVKMRTDAGMTLRKSLEADGIDPARAEYLATADDVDGFRQ